MMADDYVHTSVGSQLDNMPPRSDSHSRAEHTSPNKLHHSFPYSFTYLSPLDVGLSMGLKPLLPTINDRDLVEPLSV